MNSAKKENEVFPLTTPPASPLDDRTQGRPRRQQAEECRH
jgi:hypothetical protein